MIAFPMAAKTEAMALKEEATSQLVAFASCAKCAATHEQTTPMVVDWLFCVGWGCVDVEGCVCEERKKDRLEQTLKVCEERVTA